MFISNGEAVSGTRWSAVDRYLTEATDELLGHDDRLRDLPIRVRFDQGVAHLTGDVADHKQLRVVRDLIGRLGGVLAVWSRVRVAGHNPVILDIGCGGTKQCQDSIGLDFVPLPGVDALTNLAIGLPIADHSVDAIFAVHVLEHLTDYLRLVDDCHRALQPHGVLHVMSPWWRHVNAVADPTHVRLLDLQTVKQICLRPGATRRWYPLHAGCDGASVFADLAPLDPGEPAPDPTHLARYFD